MIRLRQLASPKLVRLRLIDGPLLDPRAELIAAMAAWLRQRGIPANEREAIRTLATGPFRMGDIALLAEDALFASREQIVTLTIAAPIPQERTR